MAELEVNGQSYRTSKMNALTQFHVMRRLLPVISKLSEVDQSSLSPLRRTNGEDITVDEQERVKQAFNSLLENVAEALSKMSDDECDYILAACMKVCVRKTGDRWAPIWNNAANQPQFADIDLPAMMQLTISVLGDNLSGFLPALSGNSQSENSVPIAP